jgi:hypothetical protein
LPTEADYLHTILEAADIGHWHYVHFRPGRTTHGWRTAFTGHPGFPDLILARETVLIRELKLRGRNKPTVDQLRWINTLQHAGIDAGILWLPDDLDPFCTLLATPERSVRATPKRPGHHKQRPAAPTTTRTAEPLSTDPGKTR